MVLLLNFGNERRDFLLKLSVLENKTCVDLIWNVEKLDYRPTLFELEEPAFKGAEIVPDALIPKSLAGL